MLQRVLGRWRQSNSRSSQPAKYVALTDSLYDYIARHRSRVVDPLLDALRAETESLGEVARMLISAEQGDFLTLLSKLLDVRTAVEVGTFTGYSSICLARDVADGGRLHCFDVNAEWASIARRDWKKDGLASRIELQLGDAKQVLLDWEPRRGSISYLSMRTNRLRHLFRDSPAQDENERPLYFRQHGLGRSRYRATVD